ncbi:glycosyltransferase family 4 protein [Faecalibaculum rodentium]|uniref:glycosyltransferase family 4 protein n=1 Tax=Faecalibaculum rodentium TaxID=1702221 RepID=UPI0015B7D5E5|nr:glycosyltransferase family 4 protein [Faecalibaculum rodentium]
MNRKKINFILYDCPKSPNGGTKVIYEYAQYLARKAYDVCIYYNWAYSRYKLPLRIRKAIINAVVNYWPTWFDLDKSIKRKNVYEIKDNEIRDADIVIATDIRTAIPVSGLDNQKGKKFYFIQGYENWDHSDNYVNSTYALGMQNIVVAKWLKEIADRYSNTPAVLISNSINLDVFYPQNIERSLHTVTFHYRSDSFKGCKYAIEAIQSLKLIYEDLGVIVVGREVRPKELPSFFMYKQNASPEEVAKINNLSTVFICSSIVEGFGLPGLEAMACGSVLVSTSYEGVLEYAEDGVNALLSPVKDTESLKNNVIKVFEDEELRNKLQSNGIRTAKQRSIELSCRLFEDTIFGKREKYGL